jgi:hypothetical protein
MSVGKRPKSGCRGKDERRIDVARGGRRAKERIMATPSKDRAKGTDKPSNKNNTTEGGKG